MVLRTDDDVDVQRDQRAKGVGSDLQTLLDLGVGTAPHWILVFDGHGAVEAPGVEGVDETVPIELAAAGYAVTPPPGVLRPRSGDGLAEHAIPAALPVVNLDILGLNVQHLALVEAGAQRVDRVDAQPRQVGRVVVQVEPQVEASPTARVNRRGCPGSRWVPALHRAVLEDEPDAVVVGIADHLRQVLLRGRQVVRDRPVCVRPTKVPTYGTPSAEAARVQARRWPWIRWRWSASPIRLFSE